MPHKRLRATVCIRDLLRVAGATGESWTARVGVSLEKAAPLSCTRLERDKQRRSGMCDM